MATSLTRNLKLALTDDLTRESRTNLQKIDDLGSLLLVNLQGQSVIRSKEDIFFTPQAAESGGNGQGGNVTFGAADQLIDEINLYATNVVMHGGFGLQDQATGGNRRLNLRYNSETSGAADTTSNRALTFDTEGADRNIVLGGDLSLNDSLTLNMSGATTVSLPLTGTLATLAGTETFENKTAIDLRAQGSFTIEGATSGEISLQSPATVTANYSLTLPPTDGTNGQVLQTDGAGVLDWVTVAGAGSGDLVESWLTADGPSKTITHNFGSRQVMVEVLDTAADYKTVDVDQTCRPNDNQVVLTASSAPSSSWLVLLKQIS